MRKDKRPGWDQYFLGIAKLVARRSTCLRRQVGALIVKDRRILCTGYNGTPTKIVHCAVVGCLREKLGVPPGERHELCLPPYEEVFTKEGYMSIDEVKAGQEVLTHKGLYRKVIGVFKRKYKGPLYFIEPWHLLPVALTPQHPVLAIRTQRCQIDRGSLCKEICKSVNNIYCQKPYLGYRLEWMPANKLREDDLVVLPFDNRSWSAGQLDFSSAADVPIDYYKPQEKSSHGKAYREIQRELDAWPSTAYNWVGGGVSRNGVAVCDKRLRRGFSPLKSLPSEVDLTNGLLRTIGFYLAGGCSSLNQVIFSFNRTEEKFIREVRVYMKEMFGFDCHEYKDRNVHRLVFSSIILAKAFKVLFGEGACAKKIPHFLMKLPPKRQRHMLTAYAQGDGYKPDEDTTTVTTASEILALQVVQILLRLGYTPTIDKGRNIYRVMWKEGLKIPYAYLKENIFFAPIRKIWTKKYTGDVCNLEVEEDNSFITKSFTVHNCRGLHAEQNAFLQAAYHGINVKGAAIYCTTQPCIICAKMIINAGIKEVVASGGYPDEMARDFLKEAGVKVRMVRAKPRKI